MASSTSVPTTTEVKREASAQANSMANQGEQVLDELVEENADSTDSNMRYAAYLRRLRDVVRAGSRYTAYTSDIGEAFRPVVPPWIVTAGYGVSWAYLIGDVSFTTYKSSQLGPSPLEAANMSEPTRLSMVAVKRSVFQGLASMALPALTIHTAVKQVSKRLVNSPNPALKRWAPTAVGLGIVPALPYLFDEPVEHVVDMTFDKIEKQFFSSSPATSTSFPSAKSG